MKYNQAGTYEIKYKAIDECGNEAIAKRDVKVAGVYAIYDSEDNSLVFKKDKGYANGETVGTKTYYTGIDTDQYDTVGDYPWSEHRQEIKSIEAVDEIKLATTQFQFTAYTSLESVNLEKLDMSSLTTAVQMFRVCRALKSAIVPNMPNVTSTSAMFLGCTPLTSVDVSRLDVSKVTIMSNMFSDCPNIETLDLSSFDTSNVTNMQQMFLRCRALKTIYVSEKFTVDKANGNLMFSACDSLVGGSGTEFNSNNKNQVYARIDDPPDNPGYFTLKE